MTLLSTRLLRGVAVDPSAGFADEVTDPATGRTLWLHLTADVATGGGLLAAAAALVDDLPARERAARAHLVALLRSDDPGEVPGFVEAHLDPDLDPEGTLRAAVARARGSEDPAAALVALLTLTALAIRRGADGRLEHALDLALGPRTSDEVLCVRCGPDGDVREVAWES